jgi:hypothetical protein
VGWHGRSLRYLFKGYGLMAEMAVDGKVKRVGVISAHPWAVWRTESRTGRASRARASCVAVKTVSPNPKEQKRVPRLPKRTRKPCPACLPALARCPRPNAMSLSCTPPPRRPRKRPRHPVRAVPPARTRGPARFLPEPFPRESRPAPFPPPQPAPLRLVRWFLRT